MSSKVVDTREFKAFDVTSKASIKTFLESKKIKFSKGLAYYELTKKELIQDYKHIVVRRKSDGLIVEGEDVRPILNIPKGSSTKVEVDTESIPDLEIFIQSASHNRALLPGTTLLYRDHDHGPEKGTAIPTPDPVPNPGSASTNPRQTRAAKRAADLQGDDDEPNDDTGTAKVAKPNKSSTSVPAGTSGVSGSTVVDPKETEATKVIDKSSEPPVPAPMGVSDQMDIAFSFDTTGSMYPCLSEVRRNLKSTIQRLKRDIPGIRMAVIAHGDYCDASIYVTKHIDFTADDSALVKFVDQVSPTSGGDFDECYELVLRETHTKLSWRDDSQKSLVMIGDAKPHEPSYPLNVQNIDWREECKVLKKKSIRVYAVQALYGSFNFYRQVARQTNGFYIKLDQFSSIVNFIMAICYREQGPQQLENFETEVRHSQGINRELHRLFDSLSGKSTEFVGHAVSTELDPVNPSRFQILLVDKKCSIKAFVQRNSLIFKTGRGFYEFTKPESISHSKEVVLVDKVSGDMFTGRKASQLIGAGGSDKIKPTSLEKFRVFVQSNSYNRILVPNTGFLYEVDPDH
ncbi:hypothetical protein TCAL_10895 [Tigriopus californicus]|uniref:VWFA domain-containing protein n=1 Tax=Tigriopus californicus TaxID=6832 RepID=A0A553NER0_TIGCA|nr:uncharacterized protein LOC131889730 [Tigriopus californicus]TRY63933.1 hypothetical protein TCAL_10895 [Tigriopus californicus]|eukprot:TCALIF_10895-PA protein Name:"Protein of unknown function" AED:0.82 eAED:0.82 QI:0/1/0.5/1/1/1/2/17/571